MEEEERDVEKVVEDPSRIEKREERVRKTVESGERMAWRHIDWQKQKKQKN